MNNRGACECVCLGRQLGSTQAHVPAPEVLPLSPRPHLHVSNLLCECSNVLVRLEHGSQLKANLHYLWQQGRSTHKQQCWQVSAAHIMAAAAKHGPGPKQTRASGL